MYSRKGPVSPLEMWHKQFGMILAIFPVKAQTLIIIHWRYIEISEKLNEHTLFSNQCLKTWPAQGVFERKAGKHATLTIFFILLYLESSFHWGLIMCLIMCLYTINAICVRPLYQVFLQLEFVQSKINYLAQRGNT